MNAKEDQFFVCIGVPSWLKTDLGARGDKIEPRIDANEREMGSVLRVYSCVFVVKNRVRRAWRQNRRENERERGISYSRAFVVFLSEFAVCLAMRISF